MAVTLESLRKSVGKKNSKSKIFAWLADMEREAGELDVALQRVDGGLTLYPHDIAAMLVRAKILFQKGDFEGCVDQCKKTLVKDTFNLAAEKLMGDAYDQLGKVAERNICYRSYHDMDPLNPFWKEEYDVVADMVAAAAATAEALPDEAFSMDDSSLNLEGFSAEENADLPRESDDLSSVEEQMKAAEAAAGFNKEGQMDMPAEEAASLLESVTSDAESSIEKAFGDTFGTDSLDETVSLSPEPTAENLDDIIDDNPFAGFEKSAEPSENQSEESTEDADGEGFQLDDDPFAALAAMLPNNDAAEDSMMEDLSSSLDSVMADIAAEDNSDRPVEQFPADDNISGTDVNSALASMFGADESPESAAKASPFSSMEIPSSIDDVPETADTSAFEKSAEAAAADEPTTVDNAFDSIFGEDELPEEKPSASGEWSPSSSSMFEKSAEAAAADEPTTVDNAFDSIFGEDELPEEKPSASGDWSPSSSSMFEKSAEAAAADEPTTVDNAFDSIFGEDELPEEKPSTSGDWSPSSSSMFEKSAEEPVSLAEDISLDEPAVADAAPAVEEWTPAEAPAADEPTTVDNAFDSIFGEDELPEEKPSASGDWSPSSSSMFEKSAEEPVSLAEDISLDEPAVADAAPAVEEWSPAEAPATDEPTTVDNAFDSIFGDDELPEEKPAEVAAPAAEESLELADDLTLEDPALEAPAKESSEVDSAFDALFGDDDLPEEKSAAEAAAPVLEENLDVAPVAEVEVPTDPIIASPMDFVQDEADSAPAEDSSDVTLDASAVEKGFSVDSAFDSLFGDDDLPEEKTATETAAPAAEENLDVSLDDEVKLADDDLELPASMTSEKSDIAQEMGGAFASMFGDDDDLDLPDLKADAGQESTGAAVEESLDIPAAPAAESVESELDKSFDSLFGDDDDLELPSENAAEEKAAEETQGSPDLDSLESEVSGAFKGLFDSADDSLDEEVKPSNSGIDFLMSGDSDDEISAGLLKNADAPLDRGAHDLDDSLNTRTLAEIYFDQGLYGDALKIYQDLAQKNPENEEIANRLAEIEKQYREKFGGNA